MKHTRENELISLLLSLSLNLSLSLFGLGSSVLEELHSTVNAYCELQFDMCLY
jgi:hypothetical protein